MQKIGLVSKCIVQAMAMLVRCSAAYRMLLKVYTEAEL